MKPTFVIPFRDPFLKVELFFIFSRSIEKNYSIWNRNINTENLHINVNICRCFSVCLDDDIKNSCINELMYSLNTYYVAANEHGKLHDTAQFFLSIFQCKSLGSMQILLLISRRPFYFQTFGNWCLNIKFYVFPKIDWKRVFKNIKYCKEKIIRKRGACWYQTDSTGV